MTTHNHNQRTPFAVIVNEDPTQLIMQSGLLRQAGLEPRAFTGAEAALGTLSAGARSADRDPDAPPALIVTDLYMPGLDGWRFCRLLRSPEYAAFNQIPILVVSATFAGDEASRIAADLGAEAFLPSPVDSQRFGEQVRAILSGERVRTPLRVLIVDDNALLCDLLKQVFANHGYEAETALTARAAAEAFGKTAYDVAVLDYHLPDGPGDALLGAFRAQRPDCVCLMMTIDTGPELALKWMKQGAAAYLHKPFQTEYLIELCAKARRERALLRVQDLLEVRTRELRASEGRYKRITEGLTDYQYMVRMEDGRAVETRQGPACATVTGYRAEEFAADPNLWFQMVAPEDREQVQERGQQILAGNEIAPLEHQIVRKDGETRWVSDTVILNKDAAGKLLSYDGVIKDITGRKRAEAEKEKLEAQNRQLQKSESLGRMAGAIAHHFNNQLQAVTMNLELAMNDLPQNAGRVERLSEAMQSVRKAAEVSNLMLTYLGQTVAKREPLELSEVCRQSLSLLRAVRPQSVALETDLLTPGPTLNANANQIQQVLTNLVTNAWEASGDGQGAIRLTVKTVSAADIPAVNRFPIDWQPQATAYACLEVADAGCGIADPDIEKIFDPFFSTKFTGRGLGLSVVLGIVRAHCGVITVASKPSRGSVFRVFLPVSAEAVPQKPFPEPGRAELPLSPNLEAAQQRRPTRFRASEQIRTEPRSLPAASGPKTAGGGTVLVVEDESAVRKMVTLALQRLGFTVLAAEDGLEAVAVFRQHRDEIRCVLCDLTMPRMNGWETLTALRKLAPGIPVILSSGYSEAQVMEGDHSELPQAFLSKPYEHKALINAISQVLANRKG